MGRKAALKALLYFFLIIHEEKSKYETADDGCFGDIKCKWACMANVTIEYNWGITQKFRFEAFCYGPKNCRLYRMGKPRAVPYKGCGSAYDEGWLDELCTENRGDDE